MIQRRTWVLDAESGFGWDIDQITTFLYALKPEHKIQFRLQNTRDVLQRLGTPQKTFRTIHIAGSNGKGSTGAFLESILRKTGLRVGFYSSPHLIHFCERFRIDGKVINNGYIDLVFEQFLREGLGIKPSVILDWRNMHKIPSEIDPRRFCKLTFFECTTVLAVLLFAHASVDIAIMETGMGGRLDATNVLEPVVSVITPIHLEHTAWLGNTLEAIAHEKAGIIKHAVPVVSAHQHTDARRVIELASGEKETSVRWQGLDFNGWGKSHCAHFRVGSEELGPVELGLVGDHQVQNASLAIGCLPEVGPPVWPLSVEILTHALKEIHWPGRFERFGERGEWILDVAHNPDGVRVLAKTVREVFRTRQLRVVFGVLADKQAQYMLNILDDIAQEFHLVLPDDERGTKPTELVQFVHKPYQCYDSVEYALEYVNHKQGSPVLVTGSFVVVGKARLCLLNSGTYPTKVGVKFECQNL